MYIEVTGYGPALVLIHGWAMHSGVFAPLVEQLRPHHTLYLVDLPGHGYNHTTPTPLALPQVVHAIAAATSSSVVGLVTWWIIRTSRRSDPAPSTWPHHAGRYPMLRTA